jgi:hypothetical protein
MRMSLTCTTPSRPGKPGQISPPPSCLSSGEYYESLVHPYLRKYGVVMRLAPYHIYIHLLRSYLLLPPLLILSTAMPKPHTLRSTFMSLSHHSVPNPYGYRYILDSIYYFYLSISRDKTENIKLKKIHNSYHAEY